MVFQKDSSEVTDPFGSIATLSQYLEIPETTLADVTQRIASGQLFLYGVSGRMGAGKDTVAEAVASLIVGDQTGTSAHKPVVQKVSIADAIRVEVNRILNLLRLYQDTPWFSEYWAATTVAVSERVTDDEALTVVQLLLSHDLNEVTSYTRTANMRQALVVWGTHIRRKQDNAYLTKAWARNTIHQLQLRNSVYCADIRNPEEVRLIRALSGKVVRLDVSVEERRQRLVKRDGVEPTAASLNDATEVALDVFDWLHGEVVDNNNYGGDANEVVRAVASNFWHRLKS